MLGARAVRDIGRRQVHHEEAPVRADSDMTLAAHQPLAAVEAELLGRWSLHRLAVEHAALRARLASGAITVEHEGHIVDRPEQPRPNEAPEPPVDGLPRR